MPPVMIKHQAPSGPVTVDYTPARFRPSATRAKAIAALAGIVCLVVFLKNGWEGLSLILPAVTICMLLLLWENQKG